jgi:hypothetical protein
MWRSILLGMPGVERDPISVQFDPAARALLRRAYANRGSWVGTYVRNPGPRWVAWGARNRVGLLARDQSPGGAAKTRWCRAFVRSVYYCHRHGEGGVRWGDPLTYEVAGRVVIRPGGVIIGRHVRIRCFPLAAGADQAAARAVAKLPESKRIYDSDGAPGGRHWTPADKDW